MNHPLHSSVPGRSGPPNKHQQALMIWLAVFPTLTILNLILGRWLHTLAPVERTFVLVTIAVPIVVYGLMPRLLRIRGLLLTRLASSS
jgi:antibiotic biosynthesis monooxygenase (ABM) superfamily enzyme